MSLLRMRLRGSVVPVFRPMSVRMTSGSNVHGNDGDVSAVHLEKIKSAKKGRALTCFRLLLYDAVRRRRTRTWLDVDSDIHILCPLWSHAPSSSPAIPFDFAQRSTFPAARLSGGMRPLALTPHAYNPFPSTRDGRTHFTF